MWDPNNPSAPAPAAANPNARYTYLVGRLRARQVTMEEATELFGIMQAMLQRSESGRQALMAASRSRGVSAVSAPSAAPAPRTPPAAGSSDDMMLLGLLAMGAGAGLVAALSKRILEGPSPPLPPASIAKRSTTPR
ncbi:MAG TPA: hypothetical protein VN842_05825 [Thermoplasmata archaeon]|nr:hypothetical protein [Thermoplasmata archaeon]